MQTDYSIVIPVYYNQGSLWPTYKSILNNVIQKHGTKTYEIIFIDDGSKDNSLNELLEIRESNFKNVKVVKLSRNFGQPFARLAGYSHAIGNCCVHIAADMQDPVELINTMLNEYFHNKTDIIIAVRTNRNDSFFSSFTSKLFYSLMQKLCFPDMPIGGFDFHCISSRVKDIIVNSKETNPFVQGQILWTGYKIKKLFYERRKREIGSSKWTIKKKIKLLLDGILNYSYFPLRLMSIAGMLVAFSGFIYAIWIFIRALLGQSVTEGWAPLMIIILILSGIQMVMLGIIGEYLWRTLDLVRNRDPYVIDKVYD